jgi:hypothetical protein
MAIDLNKPIHLSNLGKRGSAGAGRVPVKTSMNLYSVGNQKTDMHTFVPAALALVIAVALFAKFGVVDQIARVSSAQAELADKQAQVSQVEGSFQGYDAVDQEYKSYTTTLNPSEVNAINVLNMVDTQVRPSADVTAVNLKDNILTLTLTSVSLDAVGTLTTALQSQSMVTNVGVSTAVAGGSTTSDVVATLSITLNPNAS